MGNKKGQLGSLQGVVFTLIFVAILVVAGFLVMGEFFDQDEFRDTPQERINETVTQTELAAGSYLDGAGEPGSHNFVITQVWNVTAQQVNSPNYTVNSKTGAFSNLTSEFVFNDWKVSYTFDHGGEAYLGVNETLTSMLTITDLLGLIILIAMVAIVLAIVFNVIPGAKMSGA